MKASLFAMMTMAAAMLSGCSTGQSDSKVIGTWCFVLDIGKETLPFQVEIEQPFDRMQFHAVNGSERIRADEFKVVGDSIFVRLPVFNTALIGKLHDDRISGFFHDYSREGNYRIPFSATKGAGTRFPVSDSSSVDVSGKWRAVFSPGTDNAYTAIGLFTVEGNQVSGTFLTATGDYRYLDGNVSGDSIFLSCFDGSHAFLFKAQVDDGKMEGRFWSGSHWVEPWEAERDEMFELPDPDTLTFMNPGYSEVNFSFEGLNGDLISISDERYHNKVVVVQIMGSWCPNCMDETAYLVSRYGKFNPQGLEVIALAFERGDDRAVQRKSLERLKDHFNVPYEMLLAGKASKKEAAAKLPMLNHVLSFPTTIYIDRDRRVRRIHTGFSGPGTGEYYNEFVEETDRFITQLLLE